MPLNLKSPEVEKLALEVSILTHETKTEAIRKALLERKIRLLAGGNNPSGRKNLKSFLEEKVWPQIPATELGRTITRAEEDQILGYGPEGF
jgi:antitoxin VapB